MKNENDIQCCGIRTHNLKDISLHLPLKKWIAVTGVSGSGKSSLVFDTIYAESQRRFLETLGTYERQFLQGLPQGEFDSIHNLPASVALKQSNKTGDPRSVIATTADIADSMRTLFMSFMDAACAQCGRSVKINKAQELVDFILDSQKPDPSSFLITVPFVFPQERKQQKKFAQDLLIEGYVRLYYDDKIVLLEDILQESIPEKVEIVLDRIHSQTEPQEVLNRVETIWSQIKFSSRFSYVFVREELEKKKPKASQPWEQHLFHIQPYCENCQQKTTMIQASDLDWQSVLGACQTCHGLGHIPVLDENKIIPNPTLSLDKGAIKPWNSETFVWMQQELLRECKKRHIDVHLPYQSLTQKEKDFIWYGDGHLKKKTKDFVTIQQFFQVLEEERYKSSSRILLAKYRKYILCPGCLGSRLGERGRNAVCFGKTFSQLFQCEIQETCHWLQQIPKQKSVEKRLAAVYEIYLEVFKKISLLVKLGLGSAHLFRRCKTLSGGEYQRVLLTRVIGNGLTDALYVLDEPSVGLGKNEIPELINCIKELRDLGNTVLMVEHDKSLIFAADEMIEIGPQGGKEGGQIVPILNNIPASTCHNFQGKKFKAVPFDKSLFLKNFSAMNCKNLDVEIYLSHLNVVTGVSGAGKSTLVTYGLEAALQKLEQTGVKFNTELNDDSAVGTWDDLNVPENFFEHNHLVSIEQKVLHRAITSVPATLLGLMDLLRKHFAQTQQAKQEGLEPSDFSFNGAGGCESCGGKGIVQDDLFFLGQVDKVCPDCEGTRYQRQILNIVYRGKNIHQWLSTTLEECAQLFSKEKGFAQALSLACQLGLGHISLGMPTSSLSGGEAQRLRICSVLCKSNKKVFCILDEPTRGLSERDVGQLLECLLHLSREGHTFVVVEHHELFEKYADYLIKMGPGSGVYGGKIVEQFVNSGR